jgi:hypothetical protein
MKVQAKRRVLVCLVVLAVTVPVEMVLLRALAAPDAREEVRVWVTSLSPGDLTAAAAEIQAYPLRYRKEIMRALPPAMRSATWRAHIAAYVQSHPGLDESTRIALEAAAAAASPEALSQPTTASRLQMRLVAEQLVALIGREDVENLLYRLGPKDGTFDSREPLSHKVAGFIRGLAVALARETVDCECNNEWGCDDLGSRCSTAASCTVDEEWPACGWLWSDPCNGMCRTSVDG